MVCYTLHNLTLGVHQVETGLPGDPTRLLQDLGCVRTQEVAGQPALRLSIGTNHTERSAPPGAREVFCVDGFSGFENGADFYLTDGASLFHLQGARGQGDAYLCPSFVEKSRLLQQNFWAFGLLKLLRPLGTYGLHAAGVVTRAGIGCLIVGASGSGKSTLAIGLIRHGWGYLSDDAILLRREVDGVVALAFRKHFYVDAGAAAEYPDLPLGEAVPDAAGGWRQRLYIAETYPAQYQPRCVPRLLLLARIVPEPYSSLQRLDGPRALCYLLAQSGPQLFDRQTMGQHLEVLKQLVQQTASYELRAGRDLHHQPATLMRLLSEAEGESPWHGW